MANSNLFGHIETFNPSNTTFSEYEERLFFYFQANNVEEDKKKPILLTVIGATNFSLIKDLVAPEKLQDVSFKDICDKLKKHFEPPPSMYVQRTKFEARTRKPNETVNEFVASLRKLSEHCNFGTTLEERLCERLVRGINDPRIQRRLLSEPDLKLEKAISIAQSVMLTTEGARNLDLATSFSSATTVNQLSRHSKYPKPPSQQSHCMRCGRSHTGKPCRFEKAECHYCKKIGHIQSVCRSRLAATKQQDKRPPVHHQPNTYSTDRVKRESQRRKPNHFLDEHQESPESETYNEMYNIHNTSTSKQNAVHVDIEINSTKVEFQLDTGASTTVITKKMFDELFSDNALKPSKAILTTFTGETLTVYGQFQPIIRYQDQHHSLPLLVVDGTGPPLLGRDWLSTIKLDWKSLFHTTDNSVETVLQKFPNVFSDEAGKLNDRKIHLHLKPNAKPVYKKARHPPYALRNKIEKELSRLEKGGIIEKTDSSEWATPIVPVLKSDQSLRLCGDYKVTLNTQIQKDEHPIPIIEELAAKLAGGEQFSTIDFSHAYTQLCLDEDSQDPTTIATHCGLYKFKRLPYGISSCPAIWQRTIESIFGDIPNTVIYFDNMFVTGENQTEHLKTLEAVLTRCEEKGLTLKERKCEFMKEEIDFLGYRLTKEGLLPQHSKISAIKQAPEPKNISELRAFLGMVNYYSQFLPNLSHNLAPLYELLKKNQAWSWTSKQVHAFKTIKEQLSSHVLLVHYNNKVPITLTCDASPYGISAILSHKYANGTEKPISFASRTLSDAEKRYSQLDKEALSIIFGVTKFHKFIYGRPVEIKTDHKPLLGLFGENKPLPEKSSSRVQRWAIILAAYDYTLQYVPGKQNCADGLSRLPLPNKPASTPFPEDVRQIFNVIDKSPITSTDIATETMSDPTLRKIHQYCANGWPETTSEALRPYSSRKRELSLDKDCILWGTRIIIPEKLRKPILELLHEEHIGISKMKALARSYVWWPKIDTDLEQISKSCFQCLSSRNTPPKAPLHPWAWPDKPWSRLHIDFAGPFLGKMFLVVIDAHSKWMEVCVMNKITTQDTISQLRTIFATRGLPDTIVSDNGPSFTSREFHEFMVFNNIHHIKSTPYHPASNGVAERDLETFKASLCKMSSDSVHEKKFPLFSTSTANKAQLQARQEPLTLTTEKNGIRTICLNDPKKRNALSLAMLQSLHHELKRDQESLRVIILKATGRVFSAGHDLKELGSCFRKKVRACFAAGRIKLFGTSIWETHQYTVSSIYSRFEGRPICVNVDPILRSASVLSSAAARPCLERTRAKRPPGMSCFHGDESIARQGSQSQAVNAKDLKLLG
ncbi:hypothetical protein EGW08_007222 [Elysia chlorotica]|uniref:Endonuclease n=1 Tax=Elysia chlorotica TaxID=188477 RepID=A0A3S0ZSV8_ELYCH|nr:hypothetical protein EGW08_007222 [Elysia chlorotica]